MDSASENRDSVSSAQPLSPELDTHGTIFAYGSLLLQKKNEHTGELEFELQKFVGDRPILFAKNVKHAIQLRNEDSRQIVMIINVELRGVEVCFITRQMINYLLEKNGVLEGYNQWVLGKTGENRATMAEVPAVWLYLRKLDEGWNQRPMKEDIRKERGKRMMITGGLIIGLTEEEISRIDANELAFDSFEGTPMPRIYQRTLAAGLEIDGQGYTPQQVIYYGAAQPREALLPLRRQLLHALYLERANIMPAEVFDALPEDAPERKTQRARGQHSPYSDWPEWVSLHKMGKPRKHRSLIESLRLFFLRLKKILSRLISYFIPR